MTTLYRYYHKKVIILLDEYDTPMQDAYIDDCWKPLYLNLKFLTPSKRILWKTLSYLRNGKSKINVTQPPLYPKAFPVSVFDVMDSLLVGKRY